MFKLIASTGLTLLFTLGLVAGCDKSGPKSQTTTRTQTTTSNLEGDRTTTDVTQTTTEQADGTKDVERTETTTQSTPPPPTP